MNRYEVVIELDSDLGRELIGEIFDQMLDDSISGNQPIGLAVVEVTE